MDYEMKKMKMSNEPRDRLSELPDSLILNIFEFLAMNDVVRTQILSHRWENLWTLTPFLHFDNKSDNVEKFRNFVDSSLLCWRGKRIQKFTVKFKVSGPLLRKSLFRDMNLWVRFAVDNGVEELNISFPRGSFDRDRDEYRVPKCLFSCASLQKLSIFVTIMEINLNNGNVMQWNRLKDLEIHCFRITEHAIDLILSKCPVLEVFKLSFVDKDNNLKLSFQSTRLKKLLLYKICKEGVASPADISMDTELRIWTPNLEMLTIYGVAYGTCLLMDVSSLTRANLMFNKIDRLRETLSEILPAIRHVEGLTLSDCCIKVLCALTNDDLLSPFPSVVYLNLHGSFEGHEQIVGLLEMFPKLKTLVIREEANCVDPKSKKKFKPNLSKSFTEELRTVEVTWRMGDFWVFPLIEFLLKYASKLEKMLLRVRRITPPSGSSGSLPSASQIKLKLLRMPRSSPNTKLILC